jgi:4-amino-4-deoxy-L-arabinose transferase-like glycosyltransferase
MADSTNGYPFACLFSKALPVLAPNVITPDGALYIETAKMILSGEFKMIGDVSFFNLYPFMILLFQKVFSDWEVAGRMVSVVFGTLGVIPIFFLIKRFLDVRLALIVSFFYTINPHIVEYSSDVLREPLFWSVFLASLWLGVEGLYGRRWHLLFASAFFAGLAIFTRIEGVISVILIILWALWLYKDRELTGKGLMLRMAIFLIAFPLIFASPFFLLKERLGHWEFELAANKIPRMITELPSIEETVAKELGSVKEASHQLKGFLDISLRNRYVTYLSETLYKFIKSINVVFSSFFCLVLLKGGIILIKKERYSLSSGFSFHLSHPIFMWQRPSI